MPKAALFSWVSLLGILMVAACSRAPGNIPPVESVPNIAPVSIILTDTPPVGVTVLFFEITVTGAVLQPGNLSLMSAPLPVEFTQLQADSLFLASLKVPVGAYDSLNVTFASPRMTILNNTGAAIGTCANNAVCDFEPPANPVTVALAGAPFPLTLAANLPVGLVVDFNLNHILQPDLSLNLANPNAFGVAELSGALMTAPLASFDDVLGQVTALGSNQFTVETAGGQMLTSGVNGNTQFSFPPTACGVNSFSCLTIGQTIETSLTLLGDGTFLARTVAFEDSAGQKEVQGGIVAVKSSAIPPQFQMVVHGEAPPAAGVPMGSLVTVTVETGTNFSVDANGLTLPPGLFFAGLPDLLVGQEVLVRAGTVTSDSSGISISTSRIALRMSQLSAQTASIDIGNSRFTLINLPSLFPNAAPTAISQFQVQTSPQTQFSNLNPSGITGLASGTRVSIKGPLFNTIITLGTPTLAAEKVRGRSLLGF